MTRGNPSTINSPGWPDAHYPDRAQCVWIVVAEVGFRIVLTFLEFQLDEGYDFIRVGNGIKFDAPFAKVTGYASPSSSLLKPETVKCFRK